MYDRSDASMPPWFLMLGGAVVVGIAAGYLVAHLLDDPERRAIRDEAERHLRRGARVFADLPGWPKPPKLGPGRTIPDVFAVYATREVAIEFENERSVDRAHARRQMSDLGSWRSRASRKRRVARQVVVEGGRGGH